MNSGQPAKRAIAVVGATGQQGGGLVRAILDNPDGPFTVRALTRDSSSPKAKQLAEQGAEIVEADLDDEASLVKAFEGAYGAFVVTDFWAELTPEQEAARSRPDREMEQAGNAARAAKAAGLRHVVWSTLEDTRPFFERTSNKVPRVMGDYTVPHFEAKAASDAFFTETGVPTTFLRTGWFYDNLLIPGVGPVRNQDGELILTFPLGDHKLATHSADDIGRSALGIFTAGDEYAGETVGIACEHATGDEFAAILTDVLGETVSYRPLTWDVYRGLGFPHAVELGNNYQFMTENEAEFAGGRSIDRTRRLSPRWESLRSWTEDHAEALRALTA